jgi:hypothetical protein
MSKYFFSSSSPLDVGSLIRGGDQEENRFLNWAALEILEKMRPESAIPRFTSVTLTDNPDLFVLHRAGTPYGQVHEVEPGAPVERGHTGWLVLIAHHADDPAYAARCEQWAQIYWLGDPCEISDPLLAGISVRPNGFPGAWEYRSESVRVMQNLGPAKQKIGEAELRFEAPGSLVMTAPDTDQSRKSFGIPDSREGDSLVYRMALNEMTLLRLRVTESLLRSRSGQGIELRPAESPIEHGERLRDRLDEYRSRRKDMLGPDGPETSR